MILVACCSISNKWRLRSTKLKYKDLEIEALVVPERRSRTLPNSPATPCMSHPKHPPTAHTPSVTKLKEV